jgi:pimeloyl-ACP methyl ester carboxylesterase
MAMSRQLMIPAADTELYAVDTPGGTPPLLFLSGGFGTVRNWDRVIRRLAQKYRAVRFDARARGKPGTSADYSLRAAVDDIGRVRRPMSNVRSSSGGPTAQRSRCATPPVSPSRWAVWY